MVEVDRANQVLHRQSADELAVGGIDHDAILLAVADPHIAILGVDGEAMSGIELALAHFIAEPLADKLAVLGQVDDPRHAFDIGGVGAVDIVGTFIGVAFGDVDVATGGKGQHHRLPQQALPLVFDPVAAMTLGAQRHQHLAFR